jgi:hypothetical protein
LNMFACLTSSFIDIFNLLFIHIKETRFGNQILDKKFTKTTFNNLNLDVEASKLKWTIEPEVEEITWTLQLDITKWSSTLDVKVSKLKWTTKHVVKETTWTVQSDTTRWSSKQYESQLKFKIKLDVEELGREPNSSMFKETYGLKNCPTNWTLVWGCKKNQRQAYHMTEEKINHNTTHNYQIHQCIKQDHLCHQ